MMPLGRKMGVGKAAGPALQKPCSTMEGDKVLARTCPAQGLPGESTHRQGRG